MIKLRSLFGKIRAQGLPESLGKLKILALLFYLFSDFVFFTTKRQLKLYPNLVLNKPLHREHVLVNLTQHMYEYLTLTFVWF